ncbi:MAG: hypothetical protein U0Q55_17475 [Vicinamibacterales bacterium]
MVWDATKKAPVPLTRDMVGSFFDKAKIDPQLEGEVEVTLANGSKVRCRPVFDLVRSISSTASRRLPPRR